MKGRWSLSRLLLAASLLLGFAASVDAQQPRRGLLQRRPQAPLPRLLRRLPAPAPRLLQGPINRIPQLPAPLPRALGPFAPRQLLQRAL